MTNVSAAAIIEKCDKYMRELAHRAAVVFDEDADDWYQELALEIMTFADKFDPTRGAVTTWVHLRWRRLVGVRKLPHLKRNRRETPIDTSEWHGIVRDTRAPCPVEDAARREEAAAVRAEFDRLPRRNQAIIGGRFGLTNDPDAPEELARAWGICRGHVYNLSRESLSALAVAMGADPRAVIARQKAVRASNALQPQTMSR